MIRDDYDTILAERVDEHVLLVTMNRPEVRNAKNTRMGVECKELFESLYVDQQDLRCLVITGAGDKAFCAGGDLKERNGMTDALRATGDDRNLVFHIHLPALDDVREFNGIFA